MVLNSPDHLYHLTITIVIVISIAITIFTSFVICYFIFLFNKFIVTMFRGCIVNICALNLFSVKPFNITVNQFKLIIK